MVVYGKVFVVFTKVNDDYLDVILAHELGHIENDTLSEAEADKFAVQILGEERVKLAFLHQKVSDVEKRLEHISETKN